MRRPMMLPQLLRAVHDKKSTQHQLADIFARDPALAGNLLKVANSPVYRVSEDPVESLDRAVAMLGTDGLHSLIATALVQPVFKLAATDYPRFPEIVWNTRSARPWVMQPRAMPRRSRTVTRSPLSCWRSRWIGGHHRGLPDRR